MLFNTPYYNTKTRLFRDKAIDIYFNVKTFFQQCHAGVKYFIALNMEVYILYFLGFKAVKPDREP